MDKKIEIEEKLKALRGIYAVRLAAELVQMQQWAENLRCVETRTLTLNSLIQGFHKLAGSAGTFGFAELGNAAKKLEDQVELWLGETPLDNDTLRQFETAVAALESLMHHVSGKSLPAPVKPLTNKIHTLIYVLEDDPYVAEEMCITLRHFGHQVRHFLSLAEAESAILVRAPDFMICDIMFTTEGREAPQAIALLQRQLVKPVPVIFVSSRDDFAAYHAAVKAGAVGYFVKPLDIIRLVDCFEYYLDHARNSPYRVLIVEDDITLGQHYKLVLDAADIRAEVINSANKIFEMLTEFRPELILLELHMPDCDGIELAQIIRLNQDYLKIPITYLSAELDVDKRVMALARAGDDFLTKPLADRELVAAVLVRAGRSRQLSDAIDKDGLTGLLKHSRIKEQVDMELNRALRSGESLSVVMLDLDHFKQVNDTYGHAAGDKVIKAMAHLLRQRLRKTDAVGRYGGEEFVAVLPRCNIEEATALMEDVRRRFNDLTFAVEDRSFNITLSAGIATHPQGSLQEEPLLRAADAALYLAKAQGRNQICVSRY